MGDPGARPAPGASPDVDNAWDAIHSAARYLCGSRGRLDDVEAALLRYNRSGAYVAEVMTKPGPTASAAGHR